MSLRHDYKCQICERIFEVRFDRFDDFRREWVCPSCSGLALHIWLQAPGLAGVHEPGTRGVSRSFEPGAYDVQLGRRFASLDSRARYLKKRGLMALGAEEYRRTMNTVSESPEPSYDGLKETMNEAYEEVKAGAYVPPPPIVNLNAQAVVECNKKEVLKP